MNADESGRVVETLAGMTTWSLRQIQQVRSLRAKTDVDQAHLHRDEQATGAAVRSELIKALAHLAEPLAVDLHPGDITFERTEPNGTTWTTMFGAYWMPNTHEVELRGGHLDGDVLEFEHAPDRPLMVPAPPPDLFSADTTPSDVLPSMGVRYELAGWDETRRRWVYEVRS